VSHPLRATIPAAKCASCDHYAPVGEMTECKRPGCECKRHTGSPHGVHDPETPPGAEAALQALRDALEPARQALREAADAEVEAELARDAARRKWMLSDECPKATGPGRTMTVAERNCWVEDKIADEERAYRLAKAEREAAKAYLDVLGKQLSAQQSIGRSVAASYQGTGDRW
jgi:hypothetical protein